MVEEDTDDIKDAASVLAQLQRVLDSKEFDASDRNRRFLRYIVEETVAGRGQLVKAYSIATTVFGRDESFDPQLDPIVRIEASRLRRSLDMFYLTAGRFDPIRITIPKGSYVPTMERNVGNSRSEMPEAAGTDREAAPGETATPLRPRFRPTLVAKAAALAAAAAIGLAILWYGGYLPSFERHDMNTARNGPVILVAAFENDGASREHDILARGFTREVITGLTRFHGLFVFGPETSYKYGSHPDTREMASELNADFMLTGGVTTTPGAFRVTASLLDARSGQYIWSERFNAEPSAAEFHTVRDRIADRVARELAQPYGVIFHRKVLEVEGKPAKSITSYECVLRFYQYWRSYLAELHAPVRDCLERAVADDPGYAGAHASLALVYVDAYRFGFGKADLAFDPMARAHTLAQRAVELAPYSAFSYHALHLVHWLMNNVDLSLAAGEKGLQLNPNDSSLMADLGLRYGIRGQWEKALPLLEEAHARNPALPGQYRIAFFLYHYVNGRYDRALAEAKQLNAPNVAISYVALAVSYAQLGRIREAEAEVARVLAIDPTYGDRAVDDLRMRNLYSDYIPLVIEGLTKAGLAASTSERRGS